MTPQRLLLVIGLPLGLLIAVVAPAWTAYDEFTHFARVVDIAEGQLEPGGSGDNTGSFIPAAHREATHQIILDHQEGRAPWTPESVQTLWNYRPDERRVFVDTRPTAASSPVAYLPAAIGALAPVAVDAPGVLVLWASRFTSLIVYLTVAWWAVRSAAAFRWSLTTAALVPLNLALAASVSPDGLTIAAVLLAVATWTRVEAGEDVRFPTLIASALLLALAKPPYFLVLGLFLLSWILDRSASRRRAGGVAFAALIVGGVNMVLRSSENYQAATTTMIEQINYQPGVQRERLLGDLPGFIWATVDTWISEYRHYVQGWYRQLGFWEADLPGLVPWILIGATICALVKLDGPDLVALRGLRRALTGGGLALLLASIYGAAFIYFTDRSDYSHIGLQMARYSAPLAVLALISWMPRSVNMFASRIDRKWAVAAVASIPVVAVGASVVTWIWTGANTPLG